jgi:hypothetical protein
VVKFFPAFLYALALTKALGSKSNRVLEQAQVLAI